MCIVLVSAASGVHGMFEHAVQPTSLNNKTAVCTNSLLKPLVWKKKKKDLVIGFMGAKHLFTLSEKYNADIRKEFKSWKNENQCFGDYLHSSLKRICLASGFVG